MKKKTVFVALILFLIILVTIGCFDFLKTENGNSSYVSQSHAVKVQYNLVYGYNVTCIGNGECTINYDCDIPEVLLGQVSYEELDQDFDDIILAGNLMKRWNITSNGDNSYQLGITADVIAESFLVPDISGEGALTIHEIQDQHPNIKAEYCNSQSNGTTTFIDPEDSDITLTAENIFAQTNDNNSLILAKNLFIWLKENTYYRQHYGQELVQPAVVTKQLGSGDCDDLSFLYISLCRSVDVPARFIRGFIVEENNGVVNAIPHCWAEVFVGGNLGNNGWAPVECASTSTDINTQLNQNFGVEDAGHLRLFIDDGSNNSLIVSLSGISTLYEKNKVNIEINAIKEIGSYNVLESKKLVVNGNFREYN